MKPWIAKYFLQTENSDPEANPVAHHVHTRNINSQVKLNVVLMHTQSYNSHCSSAKH